MKTSLRILALMVAFGALGAWLAMGGNRGWTKTSVAVRHTDEITGISVDEYQKRFVPGVEMLAVALAGAGVLAGASFLFNNKPTQTSTNAH